MSPGQRWSEGVWLTLERRCAGVCSLTSWASAGGRSIGARQAGGVVQAGIVEEVAGVVRLAAQGPVEERRTGAGELPGYVRLPTPASVQTGRRVALVHVGTAVSACPACGAETPPQRHRSRRYFENKFTLKAPLLK